MIIENNDQKALRLWITAGLNIKYINNGNFNGDAKYLLNNMIAKYYSFNDFYKVSIKALNHMKDVDKLNLNETFTRGKFYGKKMAYIYEHMIPSSIIRDELLKIGSNPAEEDIKKVLQTYMESVIIILREENNLLDRKYKSKMPDNWEFGSIDSLDSRYKEVGIHISDKRIKMKGAVKR